jgi:microcystin-dependent protein
MADPFVAEIRVFAGNFAPHGWAFCNGQILPIAQNVALYSLLGTTYGGDGRATFALPDLRERVPVSFGEQANSERYFEQGEPTAGASAVAGPPDSSVGTLHVNFIIALQGVFPPRG